MSPDALSSMVHDMLRLLVTLAMPIFGTLLGVGLGVGVLQSATQVNDPAVGFVPKLAAVIAIAALLGHWMVSRLAEFLVFAFQHIAAGG
jgi:flagellar biosynthesis protein FliQ